MRNVKTFLSGLLSVAVVLPAIAQADETARERQLRQQEERAILELFQDLQLQPAEDDGELPLERLLQDRDRLEAIQRQLLLIQLDQRQPAEPVQLQPEPLVSRWVDRPREEIVAALDHADFAVRQSAQDFLLMDNTLGHDAIMGLIQQSKSYEQSQRLLAVAEHHVLRELRERDFGPGRLKNAAEGVIVDRVQPANQPASIGYSYEPVMAHENPYTQLAGVRVIATMPGFPGHAHLKRGDIIVQIAGQSPSPHQVHGEITNWVQRRIAMHTAGQTIDLAVLRDGELLAIKLICAEGLALNHMYTTDAFEAAARKQPYQGAWEQARDALIAAMPKAKTLTPEVLEPTR